MPEKLTDEQIAKAMLDPTLVFTEPSQVVQASIDDERKIEILRRWEYDAREMQVQDEEAMQVRESSDLLDRVLDALHALGAQPDLDHTPPTKQGGV